MIFMFLLSLLASASAQENITQGNITQELNADLNAAFQDILSNSASADNSTQPAVFGPSDIGSIDNDASFKDAERQFYIYATINFTAIIERDGGTWPLYPAPILWS